MSLNFTFCKLNHQGGLIFDTISSNSPIILICAKQMNFNQWLEQQYLDWEHQSGHRKTLQQFADYLGISSSLLSHYLSGSREPAQVNLDKIADKLGDEAYDVLERPRPDPLLRNMIRKWGRLSDEQKARIESITKEQT